MKKASTFRKRAIIVFCVLLATAGVVGYTYLNINYQADEAALTAMSGCDTVQVYEPVSDVVVFAPQDPKAGLVFYPGGKVDHKAYAPLLHSLAQEGILCVLPEMPFDLAVLDVNAAQKARESVDGLDSWYIGGHSLGGAMAAKYAAEHSEDYKGLILLASYSTDDLKNKDIKVISLYGSEDGILNMESYRKYRSHLPEDTAEYILEGGNHAQFGSYGPQEGDGSAEISAQDQIAWTVEILSAEMLYE